MAIGEYLTTAEVADLLGVTTGRVRQFVKDKRLPGRSIGTMLMFHERDVRRFAKEPRPNGRPPKKS